jgi:adenosylcobyric acid synthase
MTARTVMVQGTASSVGKSLLVAGLCRLLRQDGHRVAPFKAQNMALNAHVTRDGREIGRAQAVQAEAAGVAATVDMNPILLKPEGDSRSQVVVLGRSMGSMAAAEYHRRKPELRSTVADSLARLRAAYDVVVIEGAGSPAEINLRDRDLVNMHVARLADAPVLLVGDIDRGGVFAALVGTMELLEPEDRARVAAFVINKFRGDLALLQPGVDFLERRTAVPVLGVVPHIPRLRLPDEDSLSLETRRHRRPALPGELEVAVVRLPRISNFDEFEPLEHEPGVVLRFVEDADDVAGADLLVLPGSKSTIMDLAWLRESGFADAIQERARRGAPILGICGGCQMLTERIDDPAHVESSGPATAEGLGLLAARTHFAQTKTTARVVARPLGRGFFADDLPPEARLEGYEIHMGHLEIRDADGDAEGGPGVETAAFQILERNARPESVPDGAVGGGGSVVGTMIHGLFENDSWRAGVLAALRRRKAIDAPPRSGSIPSRATEFDRLAQVIRESIDLPRFRRIVGL